MKYFKGKDSKLKSDSLDNNSVFNCEYNDINYNKISLIDGSIQTFSSGIKSTFIWKTQSKDSSNEKLCNFLIGNKKFLEEINSFSIPDKINKFLDDISKNNCSIIIACINDEIIGIFSIDANSIIRPELNSVINILRKNNLNDIYILSGDNINSVEEIGKKLNLKKENCVGNVSDFEKKAFLQNLKKEKKNVLMIGDGINDILSISEADYGISFNANSQFNLVASDIIFMKEDLNLILVLLKISKYTYIFIWINIFWAFVYNIVMIPITAGTFYAVWDFLMSPTVSSVAMLCSSLLIILTSNFLKCFINNF